MALLKIAILLLICILATDADQPRLRRVKTTDESQTIIIQPAGSATEVNLECADRCPVPYDPLCNGAGNCASAAAAQVQLIKISDECRFTFACPNGFTAKYWAPNAPLQTAGIKFPGTEFHAVCFTPPGSLFFLPSKEAPVGKVGCMAD
ncbi:unnamed protein product [Strongylus vulgaris]|uniref:Uncharacterized protein n=1 Tax=Strongylus vulgaris TaxID=40348 RepID=A0A3P7INQ2_STRVU|nr:unnamed protein product [Strongylus vulgaris]